MKRHASNTQTPRVNILKKIKVDGAWKLMPAVLEPNGRLKDKVRIGGSIETHSEGTYYIEWWEGPSANVKPSPTARAFRILPTERLLHWRLQEQDSRLDQMP